MKHHLFIIPLTALLCLLFLAGCGSVKEVPYFQNAAEYDGTGKGQLYEMTIKPKDQLTIFVFSSTPESVVKFNFTEPAPLNKFDTKLGGVQTVSSGGGRRHSYVVENDGTIDFPIVGRIHLEGKTIKQANDAVLEKIKPYLNENTDCIVNTYIENYEVSVLGEVNRPNTFTISRYKCTILEALAMAGDMTIYGQRDNVKLLRQLPSGEYEIHELDLRDINIVNSPYYYMQQRDVLYVEPNPVMAQNASISRTRQLWVRGAGITISLGSLLYRVLQ